MNWKMIGIVTVAVLSLIGVGGAVYSSIKIFHSLLLAQSRIQCNDTDPDVSISGCSAILQSDSLSNSDQTYAHFRRGLAYEHKGDLDHAIADDSEVIRLNPKEYMAYNNRGFALQRKGDIDGAIADYNRAIGYVPEMSLAWFNRGVAYNLKGNYPQAINDFSHVIKLEPRNAMAWNNRCYYRAIVGQLNEALADCNQSLQLRPGVGATLDSRAFTYLKLKKYDSAIQDYDAALSKNNKKAAWLYGRGMARRARHNEAEYDEAGSKADMAAAIKIEPDIAEQFRKYGVP